MAVRKTLSPRRRRRRERTRIALREAARAVLERKGYARATLRDIIDESDITHPTFYKYFKSKDEVLSDLIDALVDELLAAAVPFGLSRVGGSRLEPSVRGRIRLGIRAILDVSRKNRHLLLAVRQAIHANEAHARRWERFRSQSMAVLRQDLGWAERMGLVQCDDLSVLGTAMIATMEAALFEFAAREDHELAVVESVLESFYWNALFAWRTGPVDYVIGSGGRPKAIYSAGGKHASTGGIAARRRLGALRH